MYEANRTPGCICDQVKRFMGLLEVTPLKHGCSVHRHNNAKCKTSAFQWACTAPCYDGYRLSTHSKIWKVRNHRQYCGLRARQANIISGFYRKICSWPYSIRLHRRLYTPACLCRACSIHAPYYPIARTRRTSKTSTRALYTGHVHTSIQRLQQLEVRRGARLTTHNKVALLHHKIT